MTREQALAFVDALDKSPKTKAHLQAELGYKGMPSAEDFEATDPEACERSDELIGFLKEVTEVLAACSRERPRQKKIKFDGAAEETEVVMDGGEIKTRKVR